MLKKNVKCQVFPVIQIFMLWTNLTFHVLETKSPKLHARGFGGGTFGRRLGNEGPGSTDELSHPCTIVLSLWYTCRLLGTWCRLCYYHARRSPD